MVGNPHVLRIKETPDEQTYFFFSFPNCDRRNHLVLITRMYFIRCMATVGKDTWKGLAYYLIWRLQATCDVTLRTPVFRSVCTSTGNDLLEGEAFRTEKPTHGFLFWWFKHASCQKHLSFPHFKCWIQWSQLAFSPRGLKREIFKSGRMSSLLLTGRCSKSLWGFLSALLSPWQMLPEEIGLPPLRATKGMNAAFKMPAGEFEVSGTGRRDGNSEDWDLDLGCRAALLLLQPSL